MEPRIEEDVDGWPSRPFDGGYDGLRGLEDDEFSGAVHAAGTWLFLVNGRVVGVFDGELEDVEGGGGTVYKAPHSSLPLLYAMQATGGETRAKYYTNDTPISEVDETLSSGFTGYVELSENVLSGDYYQLYHAGRSMSVAFVGNSGRMITGEEAFERADDEVGIYEVVDVDLEIVDLPEPEGDADEDNEGEDDASEDDASEDDSDHDDTASEETDPEEASEGEKEEEKEEDVEGEEAVATAGSTDAAEETVGATTGPARSPAADDAAATGSGADGGAQPTGSPESPGDGPGPGTDASTDARDQASVEAPTTQNTPPAGDDPTDAGTDGADSTPDGSGPTTQEREASREPTPAPRGESGESAATARGTDESAGDGSDTDDPGTQGQSAERYESEAAWREATTVPPLDPDKSAEADPDAAAPSTASSSRSGGTGDRSRDRSTRSGTTSQRSGRRQRQASEGAASDAGQPDSAAMGGGLEEEVLEREDRIDRLQQRISNVEDERDEVARERDELAERVETLESENASLREQVESLESEVERLEAAASEGTAASAPTHGRSFGPREALEGTDLFVRYDSKSEPTLDEAHDGGGDPGAVNENLRLDIHTQFDDQGATVDGEPFESFLRETMAFRFVEWLVRKLPYEIRDTGSASKLRDLYDALPAVDRVEFHGTVARQAEDGQGEVPNETFDVVVRDAMGDALFVANMNESRDPATGEMIVDLHETASRVKDSSEALAAGFFVTRSFFEPKALETADEATSASLLSRDSRKSFVKLSRKRGYHLCLVEARGEDLHLNVPEL